MTQEETQDETQKYTPIFRCNYGFRLINTCWAGIYNSLKKLQTNPSAFITLDDAIDESLQHWDLMYLNDEKTNPLDHAVCKDALLTLFGNFFM